MKIKSKSDGCCDATRCGLAGKVILAPKVSGESRDIELCDRHWAAWCSESEAKTPERKPKKSPVIFRATQHEATQ